MKITLQEYCIYYKVEPNFLTDLEQNGIIVFEKSGNTQLIDEEQFTELNRYRLFHYDLNINIEGIDVIQQLLEKQKQLQQELNAVKELLRLYE